MCMARWVLWRSLCLCHRLHRCLIPSLGSRWASFSFSALSATRRRPLPPSATSLFNLSNLVSETVVSPVSSVCTASVASRSSARRCLTSRSLHTHAVDSRTKVQPQGKSISQCITVYVRGTTNKSRILKGRTGFRVCLLGLGRSASVASIYGRLYSFPLVRAVSALWARRASPRMTAAERRCVQCCTNGWESALARVAHPSYSV